jgi:hypothetical protein
MKISDFDHVLWLLIPGGRGFQLSSAGGHVAFISKCVQILPDLVRINHFLPYLCTPKKAFLKGK